MKLSNEVLAAAATSLLLTAPTAVIADPILTSCQLLRNTPALPLKLWRQLKHTEATIAANNDKLSSQLSGTSQFTFDSAHKPFKSGYKAHYFQQRVSHDPNLPAPVNETHFAQRYWFDAQYYKPGGPIFFLDGGETDGEGRLPFLKQGILQILSEATGGIGIVHEHRYYGSSFPVRNLTTDSFRFLTTLQSLQDMVYFAENIVLPGFEGVDLTSKSNPWIYYGGSYAGAKAAFARKLFPEVFHGAIASSAVTTAIVDFWEYYEPIREFGPSTCIDLLTNHTSLIDTILGASNPFLTSGLKRYFGLPNITLDTDFVNALSIPLGAWQGRNWDSHVGSKAFFRFCDALTANEDGVVHSLSKETKEFEEMLSAAFPSLPQDPQKTLARFSAYAGYVKEHIASMCPPELDQDDCFGTGVYFGDGFEEASWKSWTYQFCTEWGYFMGGAPEEVPSLVSRLITPEYTASVCEKAFPPGKLNRIPATPNVTEINQWGSFELSYPRLAFIDGSEDPWLYATPHSPHALSPKRKDTLDEPFKLIKGGVHHWDENGRLDGDVPKEIAKVHEAEIKFVKSWLKEYDDFKQHK